LDIEGFSGEAFGPGLGQAARRPRGGLFLKLGGSDKHWAICPAHLSIPAASASLPTQREMKYKAQQAVDTFFVRWGDT
jgi:hypothetical protein